MTAIVKELGVSFKVEDVSGQKSYQIRNFNRNATVGEMLNSVIKKINLPVTDANGNTTLYRAFSKTSDKHLGNSELVGDALKNNEEIVIQPNVDAGANC